jgi:uncharacterized metal-binding protein YceD (DUF177 family)
MTDRFAHHLRLDQIRDGERLDLVADEAERRAIADRLGLSALGRLEAHATLSPTRRVVRAEGRIAATLEQSCVVTNDPVAVHVDEPFAILFMPPPRTGASDQEIELGEQDCDVVFYDGAAIDLGTAIADSLALCIDPYPRSASADSALREVGILTEEQASPFAALAALKGRSSSD